jgi:ketosteroid isomerase-like protein
MAGPRRRWCDMEQMTATAHPHQEKLDFLETYWNALMAGDMEAFGPIVGENCIVHYPGNHFLSGDYHGRAAIVDLYSKLYRIGIEQGTFIGELHDALVSDDHASALVKYEIVLGAGQSLTGEAVGVMHIENGQMVEYWLLERDQKMINDIFRLSGKPTLAGAGKAGMALHALKNPAPLVRTARRLVRQKRGKNKKML